MSMTGPAQPNTASMNDRVSVRTQKGKNENVWSGDTMVGVLHGASPQSLTTSTQLTYCVYDVLMGPLL